MGGINVGRWIGGGAAAGVLIWLIEGAASVLYMDEMEAAMAAHDLAVGDGAGMMVVGLVISVLVGLALVFFYAASRPRFGPGPRTAVLVAVVLFVGGYFVTLLGYAMFGLFPAGMLVIWGAIGLVEMILGALLGGWIYQEGGDGEETAAVL